MFRPGLWFFANIPLTSRVFFGDQHPGVGRVHQPVGHFALGDVVGQSQRQPPLGQQSAHHLFQRLASLTVNHAPQACPQLGLHRRDETIRLPLVGRFGGDADVHLAGVSGQSDGRVALDHQVPDARVDLALTDDARAQYFGLDDRLSPQAFLEVRDHAPRHEIFQLTGDAGQGDDGASTVLHDEGRGGAHRVFDRDGPLRDVSLAAVVLRHRAAEAGKARRNLVEQFLVEDQRAGCGVSYRFAGDVIHRGAQPA